MRVRVRLLRHFIRLLAFVILLPLIPILYLSHFGFPRRVTDRFVAAADREGYSLETAGMRLDIWEGIVIERIRVFRKGILGPPMLEAEEVTVGFRILGAEGPRRLRSISVQKGTLRRQEQPRAAPAPAPQSATNPELDIHIRLHDCDVQDVWLPEFSCDLKTSGSSVLIHHIRAGIGRGRGYGPLSGQLSYNGATGRFIGQLVAGFDPNEIASFIKSRNMGGLARVFATFSFLSVPPMVEARFTGNAGPEITLDLDGKIKARDFTRNRIPIDRFESRITVTLDGNRKQIVALSPLAVRREDGITKADLTIDLANHTVVFLGNSTSDPRDVLSVIGTNLTNILNDYHIGGPAGYSARGFLSLTNSDVCSLEVAGRAKSFGFPSFVADECSFTLQRNGRSTTITNLEAKIFGGAVSGTVIVKPDPASTNFAYAFKGAIDKVVFRRLVENIVGAIDAEEGLTGELSGNLEVEGIARRGMAGTMSGRGKMRIRKGNLFQLPLFGQLSDMLSRSVPGLGYVLRQTTAEASFVIVGGKVKAEEVRIEGDILSLKGNGMYDIAADQLDFDVELRFLRKKTFAGEILQTILLPVTKLFRVRLQGSLSNPTWSSVNF